MPKRLPDDLLARVRTALERQSKGMTLAELEAQLADAVSRRSLQRHLPEWVRQKEIRADGQRRGRRYFSIAPTRGTVLSPPTMQLNLEPNAPEVERGIPLSTLGQKVQGLVRRPVAARAPVGYRREFLESYIPNETPYLSDALRKHLHGLGQTADSWQPAGTYARDILDRLLIDLSWSSSRLEGNTYSLLETRNLIEREQVAPGKDAKETQMILNHKAAIELLVESADEIGVNRYTITNLHALLADNLLDDPRGTGRLRESSVAIAASTYVPTAIPQLIEEMFERLLTVGEAIRDPFEQSFFLLTHISYLQPFVDVNKRTSRLASNIPLIKRNLVPLSFIDVPQRAYFEGLIGIYEFNRVELLRDVFVWAYERSANAYTAVRGSLPEPDPFRLQYRSVLIEVVGAIVRKRLPAKPGTVKNLAGSLVSAADLDRFSHLVQSELEALHEGNIARFRLRPSEFHNWRETSPRRRSSRPPTG